MEPEFIDTNSPDIDDRLILRRAVCLQDMRAVATLYLKYYAHVRSYIASHVSSVADTEDLAQDVFVQLCVGTAHYDGVANVESYLLGIARNSIRRYHRQKRRSAETMLIDLISHIGPGHDIEQTRDSAMRISPEQSKRMIAHLENRLTHKARQAFILRFVDGLSPKEAAEKAGCSIGAFYKRMERVIKTMREI